MDAFVDMRKFINENKDIFKKITTIEYKLLDHDEKMIKFLMHQNLKKQKNKEYFLIVKYMILIVQ